LQNHSNPTIHATSRRHTYATATSSSYANASTYICANGGRRRNFVFWFEMVGMVAYSSCRSCRPGRYYLCLDSPEGEEPLDQTEGI
jgi:hypothetical protein